MKTRNLTDSVQGFIFSCQTEGKSPKTIEWYECFLHRFEKFHKDNNYPDDINDIGRNHIKAFIAYLQTVAKTPHKQQPLAATTIQGYVRTLKAFFSWALRDEIIGANPMAKIPLPKAAAKLINTLTKEQIENLITVCRNSNGIGYRNLTMILLMLDSGLRISELIGIELPDVDLNGGLIRVRKAKGGRERMIPVGDLVRKLLWKYTNYYRQTPLIPSIKSLFLNIDGLPITRNGVQQMLRRYGQKAGIAGVRCSPHTLRHTFAKTYLLNGGDVYSLQNILGHSCMSTVRIYLNLFACDIKAQHRNFSPVDRMAAMPGLLKAGRVPGSAGI